MFLWETLFSHGGLMFLGEMGNLRESCESFARQVGATNAELLAMTRELLWIIDQVDEQAYNVLSPEAKVHFREDFAAAFIPALSRLIVRYSEVCPEGRKEASFNLAVRAIEQRILVGARIRADRAAALSRRLALPDEMALFWYMPNKVRIALTSLANLVDRCAETRGETMSPSEIMDRVQRIEKAAGEGIAGEVTLLGLEIRNEGTEDFALPPEPMAFGLWFCTEETRRTPPHLRVDPNLTQCPLTFRADDAQFSSVSIFPPVTRLSDGLVEYPLGQVHFHSQETYHGAVVFEGVFSMDQVDTGGLRQETGYLGAQLSPYLKPH
jgi:hypothetical protein